jgi:FkbM family methyltransferase
MPWLGLGHGDFFFSLKSNSHPSFMLIETLLQLYARYFPLNKGKYRLVESLWKKAVAPENRKRKAHLLAGGFLMNCDLNLVLQRQFYFFGTYFLEQENLACWSDYSKRAKVIFDVGANLGIYSLTSAAINPEARLFAFEPTAAIAAHLRRTLEENDLNMITVVEKAVARTSGTAVLNLWGSKAEGNEGMNFVTQEAVATESVTIETVSLDDFCKLQGIEQIDLLKIDIQGNEPEALRGAERLLSEGRIRCIFTELNWETDPDKKAPAWEVVELLQKKGFVFASPTKNAVPKLAGEWLRGLSDVVATMPH